MLCDVVLSFSARGGACRRTPSELGFLSAWDEIRMERRFKVEAKTFFFSTKAAKLRLEERRKGFLGHILVGHRCASWLAATVEEASLSPVMEDFVKSSSEGRMSLLVRGGCNKAGRFLEVAAFVDDDQKGIMWIPEARSGRGWRRFVVELRSLLAALASSPGFSYEGSFLEEKLEEGSPGIKTGRSFTGLPLLSSQEIDLFPVASSFELGYDGKDVRSAWDCYEMEIALPMSLPVKVAAMGRKKKKRLGLTTS
jgi:hypothetical protein